MSRVVEAARATQSHDMATYTPSLGFTNPPHFSQSDASSCIATLWYNSHRKKSSDTLAEAHSSQERPARF